MSVQIYLSAVSAYEIKNKYRIGKLPEFDDIANDYFKFVKKLNVLPLPISEEHAHFAGEFEWEHRDPFDRLLAAQVKIENMILSMIFCHFLLEVYTMVAIIILLPIVVGVVITITILRIKRTQKPMNELRVPFAAGAALAVSYILIRFVVRIGMGDWPFVLFALGLFFILVALALRAKWITLSVPIGYILGLVFGLLFNWDTYHVESGTYRNNDFALWTNAFLVIVAVGIICEVAMRIRGKVISQNTTSE